MVGSGCTRRKEPLAISMGDASLCCTGMPSDFHARGVDHMVVSLKECADFVDLR